MFPVCVHPPDLMSMLQFLIPRSTLLEENLLRSLRVCFFHRISPAMERSTFNILEALSYCESMTVLPGETLKSILVNQALRDKIESVSNPEENREAVRAVMVEEREQIDEVERNQAEMAACELKRLNNIVVLLKVTIGIIAVGIFEMLTYMLPWKWLLTHEHSCAINIAIVLFFGVITCVWAFRRLRPDAWRWLLTTLVPLVVGLIKGSAKNQE